MTAEHVRLEEAREREGPLEEVGAVPQRAAVGDRARGLQRGRRRLELLHPRPGPLARLPLGEDGLAGISDDRQRLCFALALWNGKDPILKERLFGLTNGESNHGEDVKEYYFYLDSTPTHSYMKYLYKYPQEGYPYADLVETSRRRGRHEFEYELLDTGVFDQDRYWDVFVEYAKASPEDILILISVHNRGPDAAALHVLPTLWFRNQWSWHGGPDRPALKQIAGPRRASCRRPTGRSASATSTAKATSPSSSPRTRRTPSASSASLTGARTSRTASTTSSSTATTGAVNPEKTGTQGGGPLSTDGRPRRVPGDPAPAVRRRRPRPSPGATAIPPGRSAAASTRSSRRGATRRTSSTPPSSLPRWGPTRPT